MMMTETKECVKMMQVKRIGIGIALALVLRAQIARRKNQRRRNRLKLRDMTTQGKGCRTTGP